MDAQEVYLWRMWLSNEPRGELRSDYHTAQVTQAIHHFMMGFTDDPKPIAFDKFLLKFEEKEEKNKEWHRKNNIKTAATLLSLFGGGKKMPTMQSSIKKAQNKIKDLEEEKELTNKI